MAALGTLTPRDAPPALISRGAVSAYQIIRGRPLGSVGTRDVKPFLPPRLPAVNYIVRQLYIVYRQLWPSHGQRFPQ